MSAHADLIEVARARINPHRVGDRLFGDVAAALETTTGVIHTGVCIDTGSGTGFCAEHAAIASMVTSGEYAIARIVALWRAADGRVTVLPVRSLPRIHSADRRFQPRGDGRSRPRQDGTTP
nr:hypothetical protein GCM10025699_62990 [Microbacterium flavescens]